MAVHEYVVHVLDEHGVPALITAIAVALLLVSRAVVNVARARREWINGTITRDAERRSENSQNALDRESHPAPSRRSVLRRWQTCLWTLARLRARRG